MDNLVEVKNLVKIYNKFRLNSISFNIPKNSIVGLIGGNGSGKTTIMKCILSLIFKNEGEIKIFGKNNDELLDVEKEKIGVVLDENCLPYNIKVKFLDKIFVNTFKTWNSKKYYGLLDKFNIDPEKRVKELSKGMKAKLNIVIALTRDVDLLILDEPVNGLDPVSRDELNDILLSFVNEGEHSVLISSHILSDIEIISDKIIFINNGELIKEGTVKEIVNKYKVIILNKEEFNELDKNLVIKYKENSGVFSVLTKKELGKTFEKCRNATLEDMMIFYIKGKNYEGPIA